MNKGISSGEVQEAALKKNLAVTPSCEGTGHTIGQQEKDAPQVRGRGTTLGGITWLSLQRSPLGSRERT